jgi:uncharacterized protein (TIGR02594 family)
MPTSTASPKWLQTALEYVGTAEITGRADNPVIMQFYRDCGHDEIEHDEVAWCAAFVGACLKRAGKPTSAPVVTNLLARSYLKYGKKLDAPVPGCIAVWARGKPPSGHVGFVVKVNAENGTIKTIEGNVGNQVQWGTHRISDALGYRWPPEAKEPVIEPPKVTVKEVAVHAAKSKTFWQIVGAAAMAIYGGALDGFRWVFDLILSFAMMLPGVANDIQTALGTTQQFSAWLNLPSAQICMVVAGGMLVIAAGRHIVDRIQWGKP